MEEWAFSNYEKLVFIFGAGASKAEGAPASDELLVRSIKELRNNQRVFGDFRFPKRFLLRKRRQH